MSVRESSPHCQERRHVSAVEISPNDVAARQADNWPMPYDPQQIARAIERLAKKAGSQRQLAAKAKLDPKTINNAINKTNGMTLQTACLIAEAGGISVAELIGERPRIDPELQALATRVLGLAEQAEELVEEAGSETGRSSRPHSRRG